MNQIRFDFLGNVAGGNSRTSANSNTAESGDAFARILDQQLTRRADAGPSRHAVEARGRSDASDRAEGPRPQASKRRDSKHASSAPTPANRDTAPVKPEPKAKQPEKVTTPSETCAKPSGKPQDETDATTEAAAGGQATAGSSNSSGAAETDGQPDDSADTTEQQQGDDPQQPANDGTEQDESGTAQAKLDLLALLAIPLPLQTIAVDGEASAETDILAGGGDAAAAALQAQLAASLAESIDLTTTSAKAQIQVQAPSGGLKFGAILNAGDGQKAGSDPLAALQVAAEAIAKTADPLAQPAPGSTKPRDTATTASKARDAAQDNAAATVNPEQNGKNAAAIVQPMNRASAVTWSGTNVSNELSESMAVQAGSTFAADDAEFSNWSQALGSGAPGLGSHLSARQTAFMAQLKQDLQNLPAHDQIAVQIKSAMQNGNSRFTVALHPVELGRVEVKLDIDKDKNVTATIVVDRPATLDLLRNDAKALERALQDAGLQTDSGSLSFSLRDSNGQNGGSSQNDTGTGSGSGSGTGSSGSEVKADVRADVVATADGYVDLET
jgi:flagellar hook-length control protein FliK